MNLPVVPLKEECGNCKFFLHLDDGSAHSDEPVGLCRRYPPMILDPQYHTKDADDVYIFEPDNWNQPRVQRIDWCCEWKLEP